MDLPNLTMRRHLSVNVPRLDEYFGLWAIHEPTFRQVVDSVNGMNLLAHVQVNQEQDFNQDILQATKYDRYGRSGEIAVLYASGPMMNFVSSMAAGTSTVSLRRQIRAAERDPDVSAILIVIDSPGGTVSGTYDLVGDVRTAAKKKPVWAYIEDLGASAAFALASGTNKVYANSTALVGSIGTYAVITDTSGAAEDLKIKVNVVRPDDGTSAFKGMGTSGTEVTEEHLAEMTRIVTQLNKFFIDTVSKGRSMSVADVKAIADGRVHIAADAENMSLIDGIRTLDEVLAELAEIVTPTSDNRRQQMPEEAKTDDVQPKAATLPELKGALVGASAEFVLSQLEKGATLEQAKDAWIQEMALEKETRAEQEAARIKAEEEAKAKADAEVAAARAKAAREREALGVEGVDQLSSGTRSANDVSDPVSEWEEAVQSYVDKGKTPAQATHMATIKHPELRAAFIEQYNRDKGRVDAADRWQRSRTGA